MFSSRLVDTSSNCSIIKKSLLEDLIPYHIANDGNTIEYNNGSSSAITYKLDSLSAYITSPSDDQWYPVIIDNDSNIITKKLSDHGSYGNGNPSLSSGRIGIENFISFTPFFNSFSVSAGSMCTDWILNRADCPYAVYYGIPCWVKKINNGNSLSIKNTSAGTGQAKLENFPNGARLYNSARPDAILIKINDSQLYISDSPRYSITSSSITFFDENGFIVEASSLPDAYQLSDKAIVEVNKNITTTDLHRGLVIDGVNYNIWISDGDFFSYFNSEADKIASEKLGIPSLSYISPGIYKYYRSIYRILTLDEPRSFEKKDLRRSRCYKKLAQALSTSPFISDMSISALDISEIRAFVKNFIDSMGNSSTVATEIALFRSALLSISAILQKTITVGSETQNDSLYLDTKQSPYSISNNYITNNKTLFNKLISKYKASFMSSSSTIITAKNIAHNDGIVITQAMDYYCSKGITNQRIISNQTITYDNTIIATNYDNKKSEVKILKKSDNSLLKTIPLFEIGKPNSKSNASFFQPRITASGYVQADRRLDGAIFNPQALLQPPDLFNNVYGMSTETRSSASGGESTLYSSARVQFGDTNGPELDAINLILDEYYTKADGLQGVWQETFLEEQMTYYWTQISGPECEFIELNGGFTNTTRPSNITASSRYIQLKIKESGKYIVQCQLNSPYGTFKKQKTIYIYDAGELIPEDVSTGVSIFTRMVPNPNLNHWYNHDTQGWEPISSIKPNSVENTLIYLNKDNLRVSCPKFNRVAIANKAGVFHTINTNMTVVAPEGLTTAGVDLFIEKLNDIYKFEYNTTYTGNNAPKLFITYNLNNTTIKIYAIYLEYIRSDRPGCEQCYSMYEPKIASSKSTSFTGSSRVNSTRLSRINKFPEQFSLYKFENPTGESMKVDSVISLGSDDFNYPIISTKNSPKIYSYGGYSHTMIESLGIDTSVGRSRGWAATDSSIPGLTKPSISATDTIYKAGNPNSLPVVTGYPMNYTDKGSLLCYQKAVPYSGGGPILFDKGVLHPSSGWISHASTEYKGIANRSSVLKFNPAARKSFSFIGPKILINHPISDVSNQKVNISEHSSTIKIDIAQDIRWDPACYCGEKREGYDTDLYNSNQTNKEYIDTTTNISDHAYRYLFGGKPKQIETTALRTTPTVIDEFGSEQKGNTFSYSFAVTGPASLPTEIMGDDGKTKIRMPTIFGFNIQDIEVKLNFLNYVNTKNLVIWLETNVGATSADSSGKYDSGIKSSNNFLDQTIASNLQSAEGFKSRITSDIPIANTGIRDYLVSLAGTLPDIPGQGQRILLLNQEQIINNNYYYSITFSDRAEKYNTLYDYNISKSYDSMLTAAVSDVVYNIPVNNKTILCLQNQNIVRDNGTVVPTLASNSFSDRDACKYIPILKHNRLNITNRAFDKFKNLSLFPDGQSGGASCPGPAVQQKEGTFNKSVEFTLKIMVMDEPDDMEPNDNIMNNEYICNIESSDKKQKGIDITGSLCNWELILHVNPVNKFVPHSNPNLSSYGNADSLALLDYDQEPKYPGYSFISDLSKYKHLLPLINLDAPNTALNDTSVCLTNQDDPIGGGFVVRPSDFPTHAIIGIMASLFGGTTGTLLGTSTIPGAGYNAGFNAITDWMKESRFLSSLEDMGRQVYLPSYTKYPFGSPEKILLNVKKPGSLWYSLEATIMKYHNTHILKSNRHDYIKVQRGYSKFISEFKFQMISDYTDLLDVKSIKSISIPCHASLSVPLSSSGYIINDGDLVDISFIQAAGSSQDNDCPANGLYVASSNEGLLRITDTNEGISLLAKATSYFQNNAAIYNNSCLFDSSLKNDITGNKVISLPGRIPYDIFSLGDTIECFSSSDREDFTGNNPNIVTRTIVSKSLIYKDNQLYSIFRLNTSVDVQDYISPLPDANILFVFKSNQTMPRDQTLQYSLWGNDNKHIPRYPPSNHFSAHSIGSYGNGSPFIYKNILDNFYQYNKLQNINEILNNSDNDKAHYNKITIFPATNGEYIQDSAFLNNKVYGFGYGALDLQNNTQKYNQTKNIAIRTENMRQSDTDFSDLETKLLEQIYASSIDKDSPKSFMYIKMPDPKSGVVPSGYGQLIVENDYIEHIPYKFITETEYTSLTSRLNTIENDATQDNLENIIGDPSNTNTIINSSNIKYITKHLDNLTVNDPVSCEDRSVTDRSNCHKLKLRDKLQKVYAERDRILSVLEQQTIQYATVGYFSEAGAELSISGKIFKEDLDSISINDGSTTISIKKQDISSLSKTYARKCDLPASDKDYVSDSVLPKISCDIKTEKDGSITIDYKPINLDHYWINIDPKQSCILDFASNPKVLVSTAYTCIRSVEILAGGGAFNVAANNNVCPEFSATERIPDIGIEKFSTQYGKDGTKYVYAIPSGIIDEDKARYPEVSEWRRYTKERYFNINGDLNFDTDTGTEITIKAEETYLIPVAGYKQPNFQIESSNLDYSADSNVAPGMRVCPLGTNLGSPGGLGLIDTFGNRVGHPTRVENIFNLDNVDQIQVQIKRIPRLLRGCDILSTLYRYGQRSIFRPQSSSNPKIPYEVDLIGINGTINNSLYCWVCLQKDNTDTLQYAKLPVFFQLQNEMIFRSLFGSIDRIENRTDTMVAYYPWELIPYEYDR